MYRILLVDDEPDVLEYFERIFREKLCNCMELDIYAVNSAAKALAYFQKFKVDIVITDIQMPEMDGIELYKKLRESWENLKVIFLTGYSNFEYAYIAAQRADVRFLMKLEPVEKIINTVEAVIEEIEQGYREKELLQQALEQSRQAVPILQNRILGQFLYGIIEPDYLNERIQALEIPLDLEKEIYLVGFEPDQDVEVSIQEEYIFLQKAIIQYGFRKRLWTWNYLSENEITPYIWIVQRNDNGQLDFTELLEEVQKRFNRNTGKTISCSYGIVEPPYREVTWMLRNVQSTLGYRNREIKETILLCRQQPDKVCITGRSEAVFENWQNANRIHELQQKMESGQKDKYFDLLGKMVKPVLPMVSMSNPLAIEIYYQIALLLQHHINMWQLNEKIAFEMAQYKLFRLDIYDNWKDAIDYLGEMSELVFNLQFKKEQNDVNSSVAEVKNYIFHHLEEDLTLVLLADKVNLNASYLSRLFKKVTGENLYDFILKMRMNKAKELILLGNRKIADVALSVGYESVQSFNRVFKKYSGLAPKEFQNRNLSES